MRADLITWLMFVRHRSVFSWEFIDFTKYVNATEISMFSDASHAFNLGMGGVCNNSWMFVQWPGDYIQKYQPSIGYLELLALVATVLNWIHRFCNQRIILFCGNISVMQMVNKTMSSCINCIILIRLLVFKSLVENICIFAKYIRSGDNTAADYLSSLRINDFMQLNNTWETHSTPIPEELWPPPKIWVK